MIQTRKRSHVKTVVKQVHELFLFCGDHVDTRPVFFLSFSFSKWKTIGNRIHTQRIQQQQQQQKPEIKIKTADI